MILQFSFKNYKSFNDEAVLDMTASSIKEHSYNIIENENNVNLLKVAAIYGANASGKSNVIDAYGFMRFFVINSLMTSSDESNKKKRRIKINNFAFNDKSKNNPSTFDIFIKHKDIDYQYGFSVDKEKIHEEWLYMKTPKGKKYSLLFERSLNKINVSNKFKDAEKFKDSVEDQTLFLSLTAMTKIRHSINIYKWFINNMVVDFGDVNFESYIMSALPKEALDDKYKRKLEEFLAAIDSGITGIRIERNNSKSDSDEETFKIYSRHMNEKNEEVELSFDDESSGTIKMFCLFDYIYEAIRDGNAIFIDEMNAKLHPLLVKFIINMFHDPEINIKNAQLIYTTHDIYTLKNEIFRRDEIWFTEKNILGESTLYSLAEFKLDDNSKVRNDASFGKDYVGGKYGAIPLLREFKLMEENNGI